MMSFLIFQKIRNQLKKQNVVLKNKLFFDFINKKLIIDNKEIPIQLVDLEKVIKAYEQLKNVSTIEVTPNKIIITYNNRTQTIF